MKKKAIHVVSIGGDRDTVESVDNDKFTLKFLHIDIYIYNIYIIYIIYNIYIIEIYIIYIIYSNI